ncbi:MAG: beta-lactamase family protein [Cyclobacteriaceae bacterium]|nr:beta-lactamase family protein [Cyclobacteriaceae bacterium]
MKKIKELIIENHRNYAIWLMILGFGLISCSSSWNKPLAQKFQMVLDKGIKKHNVRGVSAAVIYDTDCIWVGTSGISHDTISMKPNMLFSIGSVTKNFAASLTLKLVENEILSLDDKLSKWLPAYSFVDPNITIRQLLNHTSGIYMYWLNDALWDALKKDRNRVWNPDEVLGYIKEPHFSPGEGWRYANTNYLLMAMIIEEATGSTLSSGLKAQLWEPHNLNNYYLWLADSIPDNQAHVFGDNFQFGSDEKDLTFLPRASHESIGFGSSGIVTTAVDLARWCDILFEGNVLSDESMNEMLDFVEFNPQSNMKGYGLGVQLYTKEISIGKKAIGHGGGNIGSATYMIYLPEYHASVVVMVNAFPTNSVDFFAKGLIKELIKSK